jgi:Kazal-type serine protease inhibitor domain
MPRKFIGIGLALAFALAPRIDAAGAVGLGGSCAGTASLSCDAGLWCELQAGRCGDAATGGVCAHAPEVCAMRFAPVCGCDGKTYGNDCERRRARVQKARNGRCGLSLRRQPPSEPDATQEGR